MLFASPLEDTVASVRQVKRRLLIAGALALGIAALLGFGAASLFARRIRRLERAADRIAGGRLDEPVADRGRDEIGQLADAFERMRTQLVRLDHARREFIANASHELRTPLFSLGGFLELIASEDVDEETRREFIGTMQEQLERLQRLATDLLDLSRLDAGQLSLELERVDVARVAEELAEEFAAVALSSEHPIEVARGRQARSRRSPTRRGRCASAVRCSTMRSGTRPGGRRSGSPRAASTGGRCSAWRTPVPGSRPTRRDTSSSVSTAPKAATHRAAASGLAIARELAGAMGGRVALESAAGRTVFALELPAADGTVSTGKRGREACRARVAGPCVRGRLRS